MVIATVVFVLFMKGCQREEEAANTHLEKCRVHVMLHTYITQAPRVGVHGCRLLPGYFLHDGCVTKVSDCKRERERKGYKGEVEGGMQRRARARG